MGVTTLNGGLLDKKLDEKKIDKKQHRENIKKARKNSHNI
jgi:hypothetical protein